MDTRNWKWSEEDMALFANYESPALNVAYLPESLRQFLEAKAVDSLSGCYYTDKSWRSWENAPFTKDDFVDATDSDDIVNSTKKYMLEFAQQYHAYMTSATNNSRMQFVTYLEKKVYPHDPVNALKSFAASSYDNIVKVVEGYKDFEKNAQRGING